VAEGLREGKGKVNRASVNGVFADASSLLSFVEISKIERKLTDVSGHENTPL
jgi:hypothetical protein